MKTEKFKVTPLERAWILYDVGNSAFVLMIATLVPIFFNALAEAGGVSKVDYLAYWGYASSIVTVVTAILGPILGTLADTKGFKKPIFMLCLFVGVIGCCAMGLAGTWLAFLVIFIIAKIGYSGSLVFYDSMLGDVTTPERMDMVSSRGYAWGYIGSCVPFVVCLALVLGSSAVGLSQMTALSIALIITAVWWLVVTLPLLKKYRQINYVEVKQHAIRQSFVRIGQTLKHLPQDKQVFWFLLAFFCYIDGVYTIIDMATAYGTALGLDTTGLLLALLVTQIVAFPSALIFGRLSQKYESKTLIPVCIAAYTGIARGETDKGVFVALFTHELSHASACAGKLSALAGIKLDVVDKGTGGDGGKGKSVAGHDVGLGSVFNLVAHFKSLRSDDVALFAVLILNEGDVCGTVGVVLKSHNLSVHTELVSLKVDYTIFSSLCAALVSYSDSTVAVTAGVLLE